MAITATFDSDFGPFIRGVEEAERELVQFTGAAETSMATVEDAIDDMGRTAAELPPAIGGAGTSFKDFDSILSTFGIHIGTQVKALEELAKMAGLSAGALALIGPAAAIAATALAAWKLGTWLGEVTGLTDGVQHLAEETMGWGTASQEAGAEQDAINRAFELTGIRANSAAEAFKLSTAALAGGLTPATKAQTAAEVEVSAATKAHAEAVKKIVDDAFGMEQLAKIGVWEDAIKDLGGSLEHFSNEQLETLQQDLAENLDAMARNGEMATEAAGRYTALKVQVDELIASYSAVTVATNNQADAQLEAAAANDAYLANLYKLNEAEKENARIKQEAAGSIVGKQFGIAPGASEPLTGNPFYQQHLAGAQSGLFGTPYVEPAWVKMMRESAAQVNNTFNIVDTESNIARRVSDYITRSITSTTSVRPV